MKKKEKHEQWLKRLGLQEIVIHMGTFDFNMVAAIGPDTHLEEYIKYKFDTPSFDLEESNGGYTPRGKCLYLQGFVPIIWIPRYPQTAREHATLAHECLHATLHMLRWANIPFTDDTEEVVTHAMARLVTEILINAKK